MSAPLVRNQHGAILGIDWRRVPGMGLASVPGRIQARDLMPGDTIRVGRDDMVVLRGSAAAGWGGTPLMHLIVRTPGGAEIVHEVDVEQLVDVVAVGAFDRD